MAIIEAGRICVKVAGRDTGETCIITKVISDNEVKIMSAGRKKERSCSILHIEPTPKTVDIKDKEAVDKVLKK